MAMPLNDEHLRDGVEALRGELESLYQASYPRFGRGLAVLKGEALTELMVELCDVFDLNRELCREIAERARDQGGTLSDARLRREMGELTTDLVTLYEAKYSRFYNAILVLEEGNLIELMVQLCELFAKHAELAAQIAKLYKQHRLHSGSFEDRDWPEN